MNPARLVVPLIGAGAPTWCYTAALTQIPVIEAALGTASMTLACRADGVTARALAARGRAIGVAAITRRADREDAIAASTDFLAKRPVHDVDAAASITGITSARTALA